MILDLHLLIQSLHGKININGTEYSLRYNPKTGNQHTYRWNGKKVKQPDGTVQAFRQATQYREYLTPEQLDNYKQLFAQQSHYRQLHQYIVAMEFKKILPTLQNQQ